MELSQYRTGAKRKHSWNSQIRTPTSLLLNNSWEEQAFAEDTTGPLGGCIWPPRSYSCSFCRREFRSAQALGGHMNVHRRDRARLKQSPSSYNGTPHHNHQNDHNPIQNSLASLGFQYPSQVCTSVYIPNPNTSNHGIMASPSSPSRVSAPPTHEDYSTQTFNPPHSSSTAHEHDQKRSTISSPSLWPNFVAEKYCSISDLKTQEDKDSRFLELGRAKGDFVSNDLYVSLNLVVCRSHPTVLCGTEESTTVSCKRKRTNTSPLPFFLRPRSVAGQHLPAKVLEISPNPMEDLDLELRLTSTTLR